MATGRRTRLTATAGQPLWSPSAARTERAAITAYARWVERTHGVDLADDYDALWRWSVDHLEDFWASIWEYFDVRAATPYERVLGDREMPGAEWFPGATLNFPEHVFQDGRDDGEVVIRHAGELRPELAAITRGELRAQVSAVAAGLRALGVERGDRVVGYLPNIPEAIAAVLAVSSIGAIWAGCSPDFGSRAVVDRFAQIEPTVLLAVDGYRYGGKDFDRMETVAALQDELPSLRLTVLVPYLDPDADPARLRDGLSWSNLLDIDPAAPLRFEPVPFEHPLWVLYSSGTTGLPKPIVHSQGGILLEHLKTHHLHLDLQADDRLFWFTTTGWMMWNFVVGALLTPASVVLFDGNPGWPDLDRMWQLAADAGVTVFGASAAYFSACMKAGVEPAGEGRDLSRLQAVGSTGSPLASEAFEWIYEKIRADTWLFSTSGGTDVCTAFVGGVPTLPVYRGELQARALGCKVESWDDDGNALIGEVGELVIARPMPSMPLYFWGDEDGERYRDTYFSIYPGYWRHGDWITITDHGGAIISGRSDATINRGGIRMGTAEIYRTVLALDEVVDALVVDVPRAGTDGWMPLFVVLADGAQLDDELIAELRRRIRSDCSPRHVPDDVHQIAEVPRTLSGKILEVPVKRILMGHPPARATSRDSLANPEALEPFIALAQTA